MIDYAPRDLTEREAYKLLSGSVIPRPIAWLTTQNAAGLVNIAPFSFFSVASTEPPVLSVAMTGLKDSVHNLLETGEAVVQLVNSDNVAAMNRTAARLSSTESEADRFDIALTPSEVVAVPGIENARVRFETRLYKHLTVGLRSHLMLLEVVHFAFDEAVLDPEQLYIRTELLDPISRLAGGDYAKLGETFTVKRPE